MFLEPTPASIGADLVDDQASVYRELDEHEDTVGEPVGVGIIDFLGFDNWTELPELDVLLQEPGWEPLPLVDLLKREQERLREQAEAA